MQQLETMLGPGGITFIRRWLGLLFAWSALLAWPGQASTVLNSPLQILSVAPEIPEDCQAPDKIPRPAVALLERLASAPSAEAYDRLGTIYGRAAEFKCAVAAFEAALAADPNAWQTRYNLALALLENHEPRRAADQLHQLIQQRPDSFTSHNALGLALQDLGQLEEAAEEFKRALKLNPRFALASYDLAQLLSSQKRHQAAIYYLKQGLANSPPPELAFEMKVALAVAYAQLGNYSDAIPVLKEAVSARPQSPELHFDLATAYGHQEDYARAVAEYKEVLRLSPNHNVAELSLAKALLNQSAVEDALPYLEDYVRRNPNDPQGHEILGQALKDSVHLGKALEVLARAVRMNPSSYQAHYDLGVVLNRSGRNDEAIEQLEMAIRLKPDSSEARYRLGRILKEKKKEAEAKEQFDAFEQLKQEADRKAKAGFLNSQGNELFRQGQVNEALQAYQKALLAEPKDPRIHYNLALALAKLDDHAGEERELKRAIELDAKFAQAHNQLGSTYLLAGRLAEAERELKAAIESDPQYAEALDNLGILLSRQGKNTEAAALFRQAIASNPQYTQAFVNLGLTLAAQANYAEAEQQFQTALGIEPGNANALTAAGMLQGKTGRHQEAAQTFRKLTSLYPSSAEAHVNLGIVLGDLYDLSGALAEFSEAVRLAPNLALAHYNKGRVLYALGQADQARQELDRAVHLSPTYTDALFLLGVIERSSPYATELFRRVVKLQPSHSEARFYLGRNLLHEGKRDEAIAEWKKAVEANPDNLSALSSLARALAESHGPEAAEYMARLEALQQRQQITDRVKQLNNFALQAANDNNWPQAVGQLREAIDLCRECAQLAILRKNLGLIYARQGDLVNARHELELALKLLPDGPDAVSVAEALRRLNSSPPTVAPPRR